MCELSPSSNVALNPSPKSLFICVVSRSGRSIPHTLRSRAKPALCAPVLPIPCVMTRDLNRCLILNAASIISSLHPLIETPGLSFSVISRFFLTHQLHSAIQLYQQYSGFVFLMT